MAIITGASRGIGKAIAIRLARDGASVVINYSSDAASADAVVKEIGRDRAIAVKADVSRVKEVKQLVEETVQKWGKIDILVNSAGIMPMMDLASTTEESFDRTFAVNVKGPYFLTQVSNLSIAFANSLASGKTYELGFQGHIFLYNNQCRINCLTAISAIHSYQRRH